MTQYTSEGRGAVAADGLGRGEGAVASDGLLCAVLACCMSHYQRQVNCCQPRPLAHSILLLLLLLLQVSSG